MKFTKKNLLPVIVVVAMILAFGARIVLNQGEKPVEPPQQWPVNNEFKGPFFTCDNFAPSFFWNEHIDLAEANYVNAGISIHTMARDDSYPECHDLKRAWMNIWISNPWDTIFYFTIDIKSKY